MIKEICSGCGKEVIESKKLDNKVWNCVNCGLEEYHSVNRPISTFHDINSIKQEDLNFLITDIQSESEGYTWIYATEQITNTAVAVVIPNSRTCTKPQIREMLLSDYNEIQAKISTSFPEVGEVL